MGGAGEGEGRRTPPGWNRATVLEELGEGGKGSRPGPAKKQPGDKLGCRASPCLAIRAPEQCVGCGGCLAKVGSASGQDAGGLG